MLMLGKFLKRLAKKDICEKEVSKVEEHRI
jgi:hypothetical protein